jgi:hypothetical protein
MYSMEYTFPKLLFCYFPYFIDTDANLLWTLLQIQAHYCHQIYWCVSDGWKLKDMEVTQPPTNIKIRPLVKRLLGEGRYTLPPTHRGQSLLMNVAKRRGDSTLPLLTQSIHSSNWCSQSCTWDTRFVTSH